MDSTTTNRLADGLKRWTTELDRVDGFAVRAILAAASLQLAKRIGPEAAAAEMTELALNLHREMRQ